MHVIRAANDFPLLVQDERATHGKKAHGDSSLRILDVEGVMNPSLAVVNITLLTQLHRTHGAC